MIEHGPEQLEPKRVIDLREPHDMVKTLQEAYADRPELLWLQLGMLAGTCARSCRVAYVTRSSPGWAFGEDSQKDYSYFLQEVLSANKHEGNANWLQLRAYMHGFFPELSGGHFDTYLSDTLEIQAKFMENPREVHPSEVLRLRETAHTVRTASEVMFADMVGVEDDTVYLPSPDMHRRLAYEFTDENYWQSGGGFSYLRERDRTERIHIAFLMKDLHRSLATAV